MKKENLSDWIRAINSGVNLAIRNKRVRLAEIRYGCDFGGHLLKKDLGYGQGEGYDYTPSPDHIKAFCSRSDISSNDSIIDIGCGKGYAMYLMGKYPFRWVGGVEKNVELSALAKKNMDKVNPNRFKVFNADATDMSTDPEICALVDECKYFYMYNPFPANIVSRVLDQLKESMKRNNRCIILWYASPDEDCLQEVKNSVLWNVFWRGRSYGQNIYIFEADGKYMIH